MGNAVALDRDVLLTFLGATGPKDGDADAEEMALVRIYLYLADLIVTRTVIEEAAAEAASSDHGLRDFVIQVQGDEFFRGCVKGMSQRYMDYHPTPVTASS